MTCLAFDEVHVVQEAEAQLLEIGRKLATQSRLTSAGVTFSAQLHGHNTLALARVASLEKSQAGLRTALAEQVRRLILLSWFVNTSRVYMLCTKVATAWHCDLFLSG